MRIKWLITIVISLCIFQTNAQRSYLSLNDNWQFRFSHQVSKNSTQRISLPHTWNAPDALSGKLDYKRGIGNYEKDLYISPEWKGKRLFLYFEGVNSVADLFINGKYRGEHRGGYSAFTFEITDDVEYGTDNKILVRVNNAEQFDIMPLVGDFNFYGGIYRDVSLIITEPTCISLLDYASPGVYLTQKSVTEKQAHIAATVKLSNASATKQVNVKVSVKDHDKTIQEIKRHVTLNAPSEGETIIPFTIQNPRLWNGREDPFMYRAEISLWENDKLLDKVIQPLGIRYYRVDPDNGFFLNGKHLPLYGVCRHQDRAEIGNALRSMHHEEDTELMLEMGVNAVRLAHYQQAEYMYDLMDQSGIITWAEIPFVGPGGYADKGFIDSEAFKKNGEEQLKELIRQNYNHPSICFWGLFNELTERGDNPVTYITELNELAHSEDPTRLTTSASNQNGGLNFITDCIAWNRYDGWYGGMPDALAKFLDQTHNQYPQLRIAISEYGAGASIYHQSDSLKRPNPAGWWHPENWQTFYHIENWKIIHERPFVWGSFIWNMFDFGAAHRREGDRPGINDKGLVTFDRKYKKDAFYFYKANWNKTDPMVHLAEKRCDTRPTALQNFMAFTNLPEVELFVNGKSMGKQKTDRYAIVKWEQIELPLGKNTILVQSTTKDKVSDTMTLWITDSAKNRKE